MGSRWLTDLRLSLIGELWLVRRDNCHLFIGPSLFPMLWTMMSPKQRRKYSVNVTRGSGARAQVAAAAWTRWKWKQRGSVSWPTPCLPHSAQSSDSTQAARHKTQPLHADSSFSGVRRERKQTWKVKVHTWYLSGKWENSPLLSRRGQERWNSAVKLILQFVPPIRPWHKTVTSQITGNWARANEWAHWTIARRLFDHH